MNPFSSSSPVSPPVLNTECKELYGALSPEGRQLFNKAFLQLWEYLVPRTKKYGALYEYWSADIIRRTKTDFSPLDLTFLSFMYQCTNKGKIALDSLKLRDWSMQFFIDRQSYSRTMLRFKHAGLISRSTRDTSAPLLKRYVMRQPRCIVLTGKAINLMEGIEKDMYNLIYNSAFNDVTKGMKIEKPAG